MSRKNIIILIILIVLVVGGTGGYLWYKDYKKQNQPNSEIATMPVVVPTIIATTEMADPKEPQYLDVEADATGLYPTLSGKYETIWDNYESYPIEIVASGTDTCPASYKMIWSKSYLYVQVIVNDTTPDTSGADYSTQDSVEFFLNEDGQKNSQLIVGDAHYIVNRDNVKSFGRGANPVLESVTYEMFDEEENCTGYVVEVALPLLTIKGSKNTSIGFDIQINDCVDGGLVSIRKWASDYLYTFQNFSAVGTVTLK